MAQMEPAGFEIHLRLKGVLQITNHYYITLLINMDLFFNHFNPVIVNYSENPIFFM